MVQVTAVWHVHCPIAIFTLTHNDIVPCIQSFCLPGSRCPHQHAARSKPELSPLCSCSHTAYGSGVDWNSTSLMAIMSPWDEASIGRAWALHHPWGWRGRGYPTVTCCSSPSSNVTENLTHSSLSFTELWFWQCEEYLLNPWRAKQGDCDTCRCSESIMDNDLLWWCQMRIYRKK